MNENEQAMETNQENVAPEDQTTKPQEEATPELPENLEEAYLKLDQRLRDKDAFISKQYEEIQKSRSLELELNELRKQIGDKETFTKEEAEIFMQAKSKEEELNNYNLSLEQERNRQVLTQQVPDFDDLKEGIIQELKAQKIPQSEIDAFQANPYSFHANTISPYADIARMRRENEKFKRGTDYVMDNIERAANTNPITNSTGIQNASKNSMISLRDAEQMSMEEIDRELEKLRIQRGN